MKPGPEVPRKDRSAPRMERMFKRREAAGLVRLQVWVLGEERDRAEAALQPFTNRATQALAAASPQSKAKKAGP